eukprot:SAG22_NODE_3648_length_1595_cov_3.252674_1_plen_349_part_01
MAGCAGICTGASGCLGFDWSATSGSGAAARGPCRARFPLVPAAAPPAGFTSDPGGVCGNITGGTDTQGTACYRKLAPPPYTCPLPPPPSGMVVVLHGALPGVGPDQWAKPSAAHGGGRRPGGWAAPQQAPSPPAPPLWSTAYRLAPNNYNFPAGGGNFSLPAVDRGATGLPGAAGLADADLAAMLTGIYGSAVGCLCTYPGLASGGPGGPALGLAATTIDRPGRGYSGSYNFFDPDNFLTLSAILAAADPYLDRQVRRVLEQSGGSLKPGTGELAHHFEGGSPVYTALSGATMPGPNAFWLRTCLRYAESTGDVAWLKGYLPTLRLGLSYLTGMVNSTIGLLRSSGSLF